MRRSIKISVGIVMQTDDSINQQRSVFEPWLAGAEPGSTSAVHSTKRKDRTLIHTNLRESSSEKLQPTARDRINLHAKRPTNFPEHGPPYGPVTTGSSYAAISSALRA